MFTRNPITAQVVVVGGVVFPDELALLIPLVVSITGQAIDSGFQPGFGIPAITSGGGGFALPVPFDQAAIAVMDLGLIVIAGLMFSLPTLVVEGAPDGRLAIQVQVGPLAVLVVAVADGGMPILQKTQLCNTPM